MESNSHPLLEKLVGKLVPFLALALLLCLLLPPPAKAADTETMAGDIGQILIPATAYGLTFLKDDHEGRTQFYKAFAASLATTYSLKLLVHKTRPNGGPYSFPSGHTASAFTGAAFLQRRYGLEYGIPAYLAASFVGISRIDCKAHDYVDVAAGATIGILSNYFLTTRFKDLTVTPMVKDKAVGVSLTYKW